VTASTAWSTLAEAQQHLARVILDRDTTPQQRADAALAAHQAERRWSAAYGAAYPEKVA